MEQLRGFALVGIAMSYGAASFPAGSAWPFFSGASFAFALVVMAFWAGPR
jgi:hypothetical protein